MFEAGGGGVNTGGSTFCRRLLLFSSESRCRRRRRETNDRAVGTEESAWRELCPVFWVTARAGESETCCAG